jgi:uncharacterized protein with von Willebrand factor type A (vWA) domain
MAASPSETEAVAVPDFLVGRFVGFVHYLRAREFRVGVHEALDSLRLADWGALLEQDRMRADLKSLLCSDPEEWRSFDELFDRYWLPPNRTMWLQRGLGSARAAGVDATEARARGNVSQADRAHGGDDADADSGGARGGASRQESLAQGDFSMFVDDEQRRQVERMAERIARAMRKRIVRRMRIDRLGRRVHLRRTIRRSLSYGGMPLNLAFRRRRRRLPRLVLLLDVSRSMSLYSLLFLRFARGMLAAFGDAQAFAFHTRLVSVTDTLRERDSERLREKLEIISLGWSGGTRIGACLERFNREYAANALGKRAVVIIVSDGLDTGPPELIAEQLAAMRRQARRIIWLNPLLGREGYEPTAGGMQAALPLIDVFAPAHNLESLMALESRLIAA